MQLKPLNKEELTELFRTHMVEDFPKAELKPLKVMLAMMDAGLYEPMLALLDGEPVGYAMVCPSGKPGGVLLEYLGVFAGKRSGGYGTQILDVLAEHYGGLFGEAEAPDSDDPEENELRKRRLGFYQRNGFRILNYECGLFGVHFKCLYRGPVADDGQVLVLHRGTYARWLSPEIMDRFVQMPLKPGEIINIPPDEEE